MTVGILEPLDPDLEELRQAFPGSANWTFIYQQQVVRLQRQILKQLEASQLAGEFGKPQPK